MASKEARAAAAFIVIYKLIQKKKRPPRWWKKLLFKNRNNHGETLLREITFECKPNDKVNFTRMSTADFEHLFCLVAPIIQKKVTKFRKPISAKDRFMITLRFLASGNSYTSLQYLFKVAKQSISGIVPEVCDAIIEVLKGYIKVPTTQQQWLNVAAEFEQKWNFPHCIGAIDGKHIVLEAPINSGSEYFNYKQDFSIVLFALCDANYNFTYVDVGCQGRISDGGVFKNTNLYKKLEQKTLEIPPPKILQTPYVVEVPYVLVGDKAFSLNEYTMKPFQGTPDQGTIERVFNYRLSRARRVVENAFGILSAVFRVLRKPMLLDPMIATKVVLATLYLHNFLRRGNGSSVNLYCPRGTFDSERNGEIILGTWRRNAEDLTSFLPIPAVPRRARLTAAEIRLHLARYFMTNGSIEWQNRY